jgi:CRISPR system Cascade subunit CasA
MSTTFDLLEAPWIPCVRENGVLVQLGLRRALSEAHSLREVHSSSPLETAALYRLLLAVLHRVFGPSGYDEWHQLWQAGRWDATRIEAYLVQWKQRFDLFDAQRPFYQAADQRVKPKSVTRLRYEVSSGNNPTLFDHHTDVQGLTLTPAEAARALVAAQAFGLAGLSGLQQKFTDGPCARGIFFLIQGSSLFQTLALNLLPYPAEKPIYTTTMDCPAWEMDDPCVPDRTTPFGYLDYLTWQNRRILLLPCVRGGGVVVEQMTEAPALRLASDVLDPQKHYVVRDPKKPPFSLRFDEQRALWRDSASLLQLHRQGYRPPAALEWVAELVNQGHLSESETRRCLALGMANHQAKVHFYRREMVVDLAGALALSEDVRNRLWGATRTLARLVLSPHSDAEGAHQPQAEDLEAIMEGWGAERRYWSRLERPFLRLIQDLPQSADSAMEAWDQTMRRVAWAALDRVTANLQQAPHNLKAVVLAKAQLAHGLQKLQAQ